MAAETDDVVVQRLDALTEQIAGLRTAISDQRAAAPAGLTSALTDGDLLALLPTMGKSQFWKRKARGDFRFLELSPQLPVSHTLYSRRLVTRWLAGEMMTPAAGRVFFGKKSAHRRDSV